MEKSNDSDTTPEMTEEIVQGILGQVVSDIPSHNQLDGMAEEHEETGSNEPVEIAQEVQETRQIPSISKEASAESSTDSTSEMDNVYHVKWIGWNSNKTPIVTQNSNGPCPMLAIANVLLLRGKMSLPDGCEIVSSEQLLETLGGNRNFIYTLIVAFHSMSFRGFSFLKVELRITEVKVGVCIISVILVITGLDVNHENSCLAASKYGRFHVFSIIKN